MAKITIEDISRHTGLSRGTISRALNDRSDIARTTRDRVLAACRELNYVPSQAARSLATGRTFAVAVILDDLESPLGLPYLRGVLGCAERESFIVHTIELTHDREMRARRLNQAVQGRVDIALFAASLSPEDVQIVAGTPANRPMVSTRPLPGLRCDTLSPDWRESGRLAARHLLKCAGDEIAYVDSGDQPERRAGFREVLDERGLVSGDIVLELPPRASDQTAWVLLEPRLREARGVAAADDLLAVRIMLAAYRAGRHPGVDLALLGQGNHAMAATLSPPLTSVDVGGEEIGRRSMELGFQRLRSTRVGGAEAISVAPRLIERESCRLAG